MGEVYRARDGTLQRDVALKILPESVATDPDRLARFRREAQVLASLNHPHIGAIYGFEESTSVHALVLELVEGPTLADRIGQGAIPIEEALPIARQIAEALEAAHEQGIIHRDLKPANIKLRPDGTVKVLDFGLAKLTAPNMTAGASSMSLSPTITSPAMMTGIGVLLGTAAYMSPEQAKGREADKRSDIWALGAVLYEMLTARRALIGDDVPETLAAVLRQDIDWTALPHSTPAAVRNLLRRCLERDARRRLRDVGEARIVCDDPATFTGVADVSAAPIARRWHPFITIIVALTAAVAGGLVWFATRSVHPRLSALMITPEAEDAASLSLNQLDFAILPDGSGIVYVGRDGTTLLFRPLDVVTPRVLFVGLPHGPFVSADSKWVGFVDGRTELKKVPIAGGAAVSVARIDGLPRGAAWAADGAVVLASSGLTAGLQQIPADGGPAHALTTPDRTKGERAHLWPDLLPDGHSVLFTITAVTGGLEGAQIAVQDLQTSARKIVLTGASGARYLSSGHLLYASKGTMMAVPFDLSTLTRHGAPVAIVPDIVITRTGGMVRGRGRRWHAGVPASRSRSGHRPAPLDGVGRPSRWGGVDPDGVASFYLPPSFGRWKTCRLWHE